jgi:hypothetical protein
MPHGSDVVTARSGVWGGLASTSRRPYPRGASCSPRTAATLILAEAHAARQHLGKPATKEVSTAPATVPAAMAGVRFPSADKLPSLTFAAAAACASGGSDGAGFLAAICCCCAEIDGSWICGRDHRKE